MNYILLWGTSRFNEFKSLYWHLKDTYLFQGGTAEKKKKGGKKFSFMKGGKDNSEEGASNEDCE